MNERRINAALRRLREIEDAADELLRVTDLSELQFYADVILVGICDLKWQLNRMYEE